MTTSNVEINEVLNTMNELVARDGGLIELLSYTPEQQAVEIQYKLGQNDECATCMITPDMLRDFLLESFRSHEMAVETVEVVTA